MYSVKTWRDSFLCNFACLTFSIDIAVDHQALLKQFEYLNHVNPHTFEVDDLDLLIKSVNIFCYFQTTHWLECRVKSFQCLSSLCENMLL